MQYKIIEEVVFSQEDIDLVKEAYQNALGRAADARAVRADSHYPDIIEIEETVAIVKARAKVSRDSIAGVVVREENLSVLQGIKYYPQTRWEPEDIDYYDLSTHETFEAALEAAFAEVVKNNLRNLFEAKAVDRLMEEQKAACPF